MVGMVMGDQDRRQVKRIDPDHVQCLYDFFAVHTGIHKHISIRGRYEDRVPAATAEKWCDRYALIGFVGDHFI